MSEYEKALEQYQKAASIGETIPDFERLANIWTNSGITYNRTGNYLEILRISSEIIRAFRAIWQ